MEEEEKLGVGGAGTEEAVNQPPAEQRKTVPAKDRSTTTQEGRIGCNENTRQPMHSANVTIKPIPRRHAEDDHADVDTGLPPLVYMVNG